MYILLLSGKLAVSTVPEGTAVRALLMMPEITAVNVR